jgi:hypothetical protein
MGRPFESTMPGAIGLANRFVFPPIKLGYGNHDGSVEDKDMNAIFMKPFNDLQEALNKDIEKKGKNAKVLFLMDGIITVPIVERR